MVSPFRSSKFKLFREYVIGADFHGNLSAAECFLNDVNSMHTERIGNALIDTIDPTSNREARKMLRYVHNKHRIRKDGPKVVKTHKEVVLDKVKRRFNGQVSALEDTLKDRRPVLVCLGDFLGYYFQTPEMLEFIRNNFDMVVRGNHEKNLVKASMAAGLPLPVLGRQLGTGPDSYSTQSTATVLSQLTKDDIEYLKNLPDEVRIRGDMVGRHCHYVGENPMYPISTKVAEDYGYFDNPKKIKKFCLDPLDSYDRPDTFVEDRRGRVNKEVFSHSHLPGVVEIDANGKLVLDVVPGDFETPGGTRTYSIFDFQVRADHFVSFNPGSVGWSRRNDTDVRDKATEIHGSEVLMKQLYYASVIDNTIQFRERWYDINMTGTLAETLAAGMELRKEDQVWYDNHAKRVLEEGKAGVLSAKDYEWFKRYGNRILNAEPITVTPEVRAA